MELNGDVLNGRSELGGDQLGGWTWARLLVDPIAVYGDVDWTTLVLVSGEAVSINDAGRNYAQVVMVSGGLSFFDEFIKSVVLGGTGGQIFTQVLDDFVTVSDGAVSWVYRRRDLSEALTILDNLATARKYIKALAENLTIFDAVIPYLTRKRLSEDTLTLADAAFSTRVRRRTSEDDLILTDEQIRTVARMRLAEDTLVLTDAQIRVLVRRRFAEDDLVLIDEFIKSVSGGGVLMRVIENDLTLADVVLITLSRIRGLVDSVTVTDSLTAWARRTAVVTDPVVVTDELRFWRRLVRVIEDDLTLIEGFIKSLVLGAGVNVRVMSDTLSIGDSTNRYWTHVSLATESMMLSEESIKRLTRLRYINESVDVQDGYATIRIRRSVLSELLDLPDSLIAQYLPSVIYTVRIRIGQEPTFNALGMESSILLGVELPIVLGDDEPNLIGWRAENLIGASA
jgi:hypothetical protein